MRCLVVTPSLGFRNTEAVTPGGLARHCRLVIRALASTPTIKELTVYSLTDSTHAAFQVERMLRVYAHPELNVNIKVFNGSRRKLILAIISNVANNSFDVVHYLHINQARMSMLPNHPPYVVWEIGRELFRTLDPFRLRALEGAKTLLCISYNTSLVCRSFNPSVPLAKVVYPCVEPPLYELESTNNDVTIQYDPRSRLPIVMIVSNLVHGMMDKGHQELIRGWPEVTTFCPSAQLWIVGDGNARSYLEELVCGLPDSVAAQIKFCGRLTEEELHQLWHNVRVFAMPSRGEGFGLVFVEAAKYGIPAIGSIHDSVKEIVEDGKTGILVRQTPTDISKACIMLLTDDSIAAKFGARARNRYEELFTFDSFRFRCLDALGYLK